MKVGAGAMRKIWSRVSSRLPSVRRGGAAKGYADHDAPLRSELLSADQMEEHGKVLAATHALHEKRGGDELLARLADNEAVLAKVFDRLGAAVKAKRGITPAGEWLLDNFHLIDDQIRTAKKHFPKSYSRGLPRLSSGTAAGLPRVYAIALASISHGDGRLELECLSRFVAAYQGVHALELGELWAIPIMMRLALIENLRRLAVRLAAARTYRDQADFWVNQMMDIAEKDPKSLVLVVADMARSNPPMETPFVAELARRLQGQSSALALPLTWIEQRLAESSFTIEHLVQVETRQQAADQLTVSNSIGSLRFLGEMDWCEFVETMSVVEHKLRHDPAGVYHKMDFATRDRYRHEIERLAKGSRRAEIEVADKAIAMASDALTRMGAGERNAHVGFYLVGNGLAQFEASLMSHLSLGDTLRRQGERAPLFCYLGAIAALTLLFAGGLLAIANEGGLAGWRLAALAILLMLGMSQLAVALVNWIVTLLARAHPLPRMAFVEGIPARCRTLVAVPSMLGDTDTIGEMIAALEVRFLANQDNNLHFGLITDFADAASETMPGDAQLLALAQHGIEALNVRYGGVRQDRFFLFHRPRRWNARERVWMGYERKRGKLGDLNAYLRGSSADARGERFALVVGNTDVLSGVEYVITLDTDTQLPRDAARQFVSVMAHPLNRPHYDETLGRVVEGYGILQPRVAARLPSTNRSIYAGWSGSDAGIDPYTRVVSDVYQDLFGEGSFIGKGIYHVDVFERALAGRLPEDRILSHDLLEGCYARAGLISDVQLYEDYPSRYSADAKRQERWVRGDWQIAHWLLPTVRGGDAHAKSRPNPLSALSRWKILDNLRRSLVPAALTLLLIASWLVLTPLWLWTLAALGVVLIPFAVATGVGLLRRPDELSIRRHVVGTMRSASGHLGRPILTIACLPYEAFVNMDAIARTAWRMLVTRHKLLEWNASEEVSRREQTDLVASLRAMWIAPLVAIATATALMLERSDALPVAATILTLWLGSPLITWWISRPHERREEILDTDQLRYLRALARKTWAFFETFVGPDDHWLPPDNFQEQPEPLVAHRTSPTNMGMSLLANLAAYDFGYIAAGQLIERTANTLDTMRTLERRQGHFFNWYDTQSLKPLPPHYISSVDSGNLAGHLLTLRRGLLALEDAPIFDARVFDGLSDTHDQAARAAQVAGNGVAQHAMKEFDLRLRRAADAVSINLREAHDALVELAHAARAICAASEAAGGAAGAAHDDEVAFWSAALVSQCDRFLADLESLGAGLTVPTAMPASGAESGPIPTLRELAAHRSGAAAERIAAIARLVALSGELAVMEYDFLYDKARQLLAIGYNAEERRRDTSYYDLLASEARLGSFVAIAQGQLPQENWFALGRVFTSAGGPPTLVSWSGSMFEYLMPLLVMPTEENTLLDATYGAMVERHVTYGAEHGVPWGISESGYGAVDASGQYQYSAFGVPGLGLKRGLEEDLVVAPYASALALMVAPRQACANLQRLSAEGIEGRYGMYEAVDYTPSRVPPGQAKVVVRSYMAHHQGMSFLSLAYRLLGRPMQRRFMSEPIFEATALLLEERIPRVTSGYTESDMLDALPVGSDATNAVRVIQTPNTSVPQVQLLSNGRYHVMVTNAGGGYSRWKDLAVTRWQEDRTRDNWGTFCYLRDVANDMVWSNTWQPTAKRADRYEAIFSEGRAQFRRVDSDFDTETEMVVSPEDDIELRRVRVTNRSGIRKVIEATSYAEVVIAPAASDATHPAFSKLFVETEILASRHAIVCARRPRAANESVPCMFHLMTVEGVDAAKASYETDRMRFLGRGNDCTMPDALRRGGKLTGTQGPVLDPVVAIRYRLELDDDETVTIDIVTGICETRDAAMSLIDKYRDPRLTDRVLELAWTHSQVVLRQINATEADAQLYSRLASYILYANSLLRAEASVLLKNRRGQSGLWGYAVSGDLPIVLLQIADPENIHLVRQLVQAHAYWHLKGLAVDLVIWNEDHDGYRQQLQEQISGLIAVLVPDHQIDRPGGIFVRHAEQISDEDRTLFHSVARVILADGWGTLAEQVDRHGAAAGRSARLDAPRLVTTRAHRPEAAALADVQPPGLAQFNGLGGFSADGREYVIASRRGKMSPAPWVNVIANAQFGTVISESGSAYTWSENAHEFRLTPWHNDPVSDASGEAFYLRDEESGHFWSPTSWPCESPAPYVTRHGFGYSVFEHVEAGIRSELWVYVAIDAPIKFSILKIKNESGRTRKLSATGYVEWVLGELRPKTAMHVTTEIDPRSGALYARNAYNTEFSNRVAAFDVDDAPRGYTGDRTEFIGRNGSLAAPAAMSLARLSGKVGAALDPCAAIQIPFELGDGQSREIVFRLGAGRDIDDVHALMHRFRGAAVARETLDKVRQSWRRILGAVQVKTPDASLDVLVNGWLLYQTIACRLWARSGFYQSSGAFGFRDQLQDTMALVHTEPALAREHLLLCAERQFVEGDVQHWWHPPAGRGVRTHCSDDYLWLPWAMCRYVATTGDTGMLGENVPFLEGRALGAEEQSYYDLPVRSAQVQSMYQHGVRAIEHGLRFGAHGLPLMGSGDWCDGMDHVGAEGKGESVWLAFFLYDVLTGYATLAAHHDDNAFAERCRSQAELLRGNIERHGWDGKWYRRAYFDDGTPLGTEGGAECQIDSIAQSWSVLSGAGEAQHAREAMAALDARLVDREHVLIKLLAPPFDKSALNPGYIKGYVPGVRENGGQYTHGAIWAAMAFARLGDHARAWELFGMMNPLNHAKSREAIGTYMIEPYVMAGDVYAEAPHAGRGGWTWYTGSAGWMYRLIVESLLGLRLAVDKLSFVPCLPADWKSFAIDYRYRETLYRIGIVQAIVGADGSDGALRVSVDGVVQADASVTLIDDRKTHEVEVRITRAPDTPPQGS